MATLDTRQVRVFVGETLDAMREISAASIGPMETDYDPPAFEWNPIIGESPLNAVIEPITILFKLTSFHKPSVQWPADIDAILSAFKRAFKRKSKSQRIHARRVKQARRK